MITPIDLRSDTVTRPTSGMRAAIAAAPVGDDQYGEDITTNRLQSRMAELLGKEAALWLPTGTMANQVALRTLTRPGDEVVACRESHLAWHEVGGAAANAGVQIIEVGRVGVFTSDDLRAASKPKNFPIFPTTTVVALENTHNRAGGVVVPQATALGICAAARELKLATFLDGARLWNASIASGVALPVGCPWQKWPHPSTWWPWPSARASGRRAGRCWRVRKTSSPLRTAIATAWAERCARTASSAPPRCTRSTTTFSA
jgi:threonine aldolase